MLNVASNVVADLVERRFLKDKLPKATPGTYEALEQLGKSNYDPKLGGGIIKNEKGLPVATIFEESICAIGGSCMEVITVDPWNIDHGVRIIHVTRDNRLLNVFIGKQGPKTGEDASATAQEFLAAIPK